MRAMKPLVKEVQIELPFVSPIIGILFKINYASTYFLNWLSFYLLKHAHLTFAEGRKAPVYLCAYGKECSGHCIENCRRMH